MPDEVVIGWIGTPITVKYLRELQGALSRIARKYPVTLRCVGTSTDYAMKGIAIENVEWEESTEVAQILNFDIGIMPLTDDPFARGKSGLKLIQYMACGIPSIASPV
ncbi:glycosyltransferase [Candidatus Bipolaricaulota bacterium]